MELENICKDDNYKAHKEQMLSLESFLESIKEDVKNINPGDDEEKFNKKCIGYIDKMKEIYLRIVNLGSNKNKRDIDNTFKGWLIKKNKFYQTSRDKIEPYPKRMIRHSDAKVEFYMTKEHKAKYLEKLTEKLKEYNAKINKNKKNPFYRLEGNPSFELVQAKEFSKEIFNESFSIVEDSYKSKLEEHNKKEDLKRSKEKVMTRTSRSIYLVLNLKLKK